MDMRTIKTEFTAVYENYADALFRFAYFSVRDRDIAKDLVADTFTKAWIYLAEGKKVENIRALCYKILRNAIIDHWRKRKAESLDNLIEEGFEPQSGSGKEDAEERNDRAEVRAAIASLPAAYREVIELRYIEGYSPKEIASLLGVTATLVSVRIFRGQKLLAQRIHL